MKVKGGEAVVKSLVDHNVKIVYGLPGSNILEIFNSLRDESHIKTMLLMHEINTAFMADAHGRLTGEPGVCLVTAGPGATNAVTGIAQAYTEASPVIQITGHPSTRKKTEPYHSVDDLDFLLKIYEPLTKWSVRVERTQDIMPILDKAFAVATSGRPGPVHLEIPTDVLASSGKIGESKVDSKIEPQIDTISLRRIADILESADSPIIAVGRGVLREFCSDEVTRLAKRLGAPILTLPTSTSAVRYECSLYLGYDLPVYGDRWMIHPLLNSVINEADVILTLGFYASERFACFRDKSCILIHIHHDALMVNHENSTNLRGECKHTVIDVETNIKHFVISLEKEIKQKRADAYVQAIEERVSHIKKEIHADIAKSIKWGRKPIHPGEVGTELRHILEDNAIVTLDVGSCAAWMELCYRSREPNMVLTPGRYGSMGFALPGAMAAKVNFPDRQVVAITGDGGFLMSYMDFPTLIKYGLGIVVIVENNRRYGSIWHMQRTQYRGRTFATEIDVSNFAEYARAFGATGIKVSDPEELKHALEEAVNTKGPVLVDIDTAYKFPNYMPRRIVRWLRTMKHLGGIK